MFICYRVMEYHSQLFLYAKKVNELLHNKTVNFKGVFQDFLCFETLILVYVMTFSLNSLCLYGCGLASRQWCFLIGLIH